MNTRAALLSATLLATPLAGCGASGGEAGATKTVTAAPKSGSTPSSSQLACTDPNITQAEWIQRCAGQAGSGEDDGAMPDDGATPELYEVEQGQPSSKAGEVFTLTKITCGVNSIPKGAHDDQYNEVTYKAPAGKTFCLAEGTYLNATTAPDQFGGLGNLVAGELSYEPSSDDTESRGILNLKDGYVNDGSSLNPGDKGKHVAVYTVPTGTKATGVQYPSVDPTTLMKAK